MGRRLKAILLMIGQPIPAPTYPHKLCARSTEITGHSLHIRNERQHVSSGSIQRHRATCVRVYAAGNVRSMERMSIAAYSTHRVPYLVTPTAETTSVVTISLGEANRVFEHIALHFPGLTRQAGLIAHHTMVPRPCQKLLFTLTSPMSRSQITKTPHFGHNSATLIWSNA
jgi:hypothetical protein